MTRLNMALLALLFALVLWTVTRAEAMPQGMKVIVEDNSGPWILAAALITGVAGIAVSVWRLK